MKIPIKTTIQILLTLVILFAPDTWVLAQDTWDIGINLISPQENPDSMTLKVYFTISEGNSGAPVTNAQFANGQITLLNMNYVADATIKKPDIPIYITILMDASGSMSGSAGVLTNAAKLSLNNIPDDSLFSVVQFDDNIRQLQDFTENISAVSYAIDQYKVANKGTCLYDAAYTVVESMSNLPLGRRAVILFTDGKDEKINGEPCSQHQYQELIDLAMKSQVTLNTIGLSTQAARINTMELQAMASSTGGFSSIASRDNLAASFSKIMDALKAQWMAEAVVYPKSGSNNAVLTLTVKDNKTLNEAFTLESGTDYPGPVSPVTINLTGLVLSAVKQSYEVQLGMTSPELVEYVKFEVWDKEVGSKVGEFQFTSLAEANTFLFPTETLTIDSSYELRISVISKADKTPIVITRDDQGKTSTQLIHEFKFDPSSAYPTMQVLSILEKSGNLVMNVGITNPDLVGGFDGWLVDETTNTQVPNSNFTAEALTATSGTITIPMKANRIANGKYTVIVRTLAKNNNVFSTQNVTGVTYKAPSVFQRIGSALIAKPIFLIGVVAIILVIVGFLMISSARQKSMSGTPVLQGRMGGKLGKSRKSRSPVIPVSVNEPIPFRQPVPLAPPPVIPPQPVPPLPITPQPIVPQPIAPQPVQVPPTAMQNRSNPAPVPQGDNATMVVASREKPQLRPSLTIMSFAGSTTPGRQIILDQFPYVIGRTEGQLVIPEGSVSRRHAQITCDAGAQVYYITDLNSSNGTKLNGQPMTKGQPMLLTSGCMIDLGPNVTIRFELG